MKAITLALIFIASHCYAQETKTITKDSAGKYEQSFEVLKSNSRIKQGKYTLTLLRKSKLFTTGFYKNNLRDSIWSEYDYAGSLLAQGSYKDGKKNGEWIYYDGKSGIINKYDFSKDELTYHKPTALDGTHRYLVINDKDSVITKLDCAPFYLGGEALMSRTTIYDHQPPLAALEKQLVATVVVKFVIDKDGHTSNYAIESPVGYGCDEEAMRLAKMLPGKWIPGRLNGKNVTAVMRVPLSFNFTVTTTIIMPTRIINH